MSLILPRPESFEYTVNADLPSCQQVLADYTKSEQSFQLSTDKTQAELIQTDKPTSLLASCHQSLVPRLHIQLDPRGQATIWRCTVQSSPAARLASRLVELVLLLTFAGAVLFGARLMPLSSVSLATGCLLCSVALYAGLAVGVYAYVLQIKHSKQYRSLCQQLSNQLNDVQP